jgi:heparan-alpha-glucosaminide N-acetyltransferase
LISEGAPRAAEQLPSVGITGQRVDTRVVSIDIFRGLTMLVMIFVNDLASVKGLPWWTYHMEDANGLTYVDMVFPAFLFIVGMSLPLAVKARLKKDASLSRLWLHVLWRTFSLLVLGLILANAWRGDAALMRISSPAWAFTALAGAVLFWNVYGASERFQMLFRGLKFAGLVLMIGMFLIYRRTTPNGQVAWIDFSYWEILGIIGWTYLATSILYIPTRAWRWAPVAWFGLLLLLSIASTAKWVSWPNLLPPYLWPFDTGSHCMIVMGGVITSTIFLSDVNSFARKMKAALVFAFSTLAGAVVLMPLGISKNRATPSWCLYSAGSSALIFAALYWICDVKKQSKWAFWIRPAGANTLTTYLVPDLYYFGAAATGLSLFGNFDSGWPGVVRAVVFTFVMPGLAALLTKWRVRMQL